MVCEGESVKFAFIADMGEENERKPREGRFPVTFMCEMLEVSRQGYYAWKKRAPSARQKEDVTLTTLIAAIHEAHKGRYGIDRIQADLARNGYRVSPKRVRRLARAAGLACVHPRPYKATTVQDKANTCGLADLVGRDFVPAGKNQLWYGSGSRREFHPPAPTEPCVIVSHYTALAILITRNCGTIASERTSPGIAA